MIEETISYKIVRQIINHLYSSEVELSDELFLFIYRLFNKKGGSWVQLIDGDIENFTLLEELIKMVYSEKSKVTHGTF